MKCSKPRPCFDAAVPRQGWLLVRLLARAIGSADVPHLTPYLSDSSMSDTRQVVAASSNRWVVVSPLASQRAGSCPQRANDSQYPLMTIPPFAISDETTIEHSCSCPPPLPHLPSVMSFARWVHVEIAATSCQHGTVLSAGFFLSVLSPIKK